MGTFDDIFREWARAEIQKIDIANYNGAMLAYTDKANIANELGLNSKQKLGVAPFPAAPASNNLLISPQPQEAPVPVKKKKSWLPVVGAALAGAALTAGGIGLYNLKPEPPQQQIHGKVGVDVIGWPTQ